MRWTKDRRFNVAWSLLRDIQPSKVLTSMRVGVDGAQRAFEMLAQGRTTSAEIVFNEGSTNASASKL